MSTQQDQRDAALKELFEEGVELTGFDISVVEVLFAEYVDSPDALEVDFLEYLVSVLGDFAFVRAALDGEKVEGCINAYDEVVTELGYVRTIED
jgi:hypothetical protein